MKCPTCGYMMSDLEAECRRCKNFAAQELPLPLRAAPAQEPHETLMPPASPTEAATSPQRTGSRKLAGIVVAVVLLLVVGVAAGMFYVAYHQNEAAHLAADTASQIQTIKQQGESECVAGDQEGCSYALNRLRDLGDTADLNPLKADLLVSQYLMSNIGYAPQSRVFSETGHLPASELYSLSLSAALRGDRNTAYACLLLENQERARGNLGTPTSQAGSSSSQDTPKNGPPIAIPPAPNLGLPPGESRSSHQRQHHKTPDIGLPDQTPA